MVVRSRPEWLRHAANKTFEDKRPRLAKSTADDNAGDEMDEEQEEKIDGSMRSVAVNVLALPLDGDGGSYAAEATDTGLEQLETLRRRQQDQMQALLTRQTEIAEQQMALLAQQEQQREAQLERQLEIERERERLQSLQQEQLTQTEMVLEQQRYFLDDKQLRNAESCGGDLLVHGGCGGGGGKPQQAPPLLGGNCFSTEI